MTHAVMDSAVPQVLPKGLLPQTPKINNFFRAPRFLKIFSNILVLFNSLPIQSMFDLLKFLVDIFQKKKFNLLSLFQISNKKISLYMSNF